MKFFQRDLVYNCLPGVNPRQLLMARYHLLRTPWGSLNIHVFHASDAGRDLHDHPWSYVSMILWRGYREVLPAGRVVRRWPLSIAAHAATHAHRVELVDSKPAVTLIWTGTKRRAWGFFSDTDAGWIPWREYVGSKGCS